MRLRNAVLFLFIIAGLRTAQAEMWNIVADEFPPYTCVHCPDGGAAIFALRTALKSVDVDIEVTSIPFVHVLREAKSAKFVGYFSWPGSLQSGYVLPTKPIYLSPLILVLQKNRSFEWNELNDLRGKKIGLYQGSGYYPELIELSKKGIIKTETYPSDVVRMRLVAQGKLDAAVMDFENARYYMNKLPVKFSSKLYLNEKVLVRLETYLALRAKDKNKLELLEKALANIDTQLLIDDYIKKNFDGHEKRP